MMASFLSVGTTPLPSHVNMYFNVSTFPIGADFHIFHVNTTYQELNMRSLTYRHNGITIYTFGIEQPIISNPHIQLLNIAQPTADGHEFDVRVSRCASEQSRKKSIILEVTVITEGGESVSNMEGINIPTGTLQISKCDNTIYDCRDLIIQQEKTCPIHVFENHHCYP